MSADPTLNIVVFELKHFLRRENLPESVPTRASNGIELAWRQVQRQAEKNAARVVRILSEWEPSALTPACYRLSVSGLERIVVRTTSGK
jgi:hypothetical protein